MVEHKVLERICIIECAFGYIAHAVGDAQGRKCAGNVERAEVKVAVLHVIAVGIEAERIYVVGISFGSEHICEETVLRARSADERNGERFKPRKSGKRAALERGIALGNGERSYIRAIRIIREGLRRHRRRGERKRYIRLAAGIAYDNAVLYYEIGIVLCSPYGIQGDLFTLFAEVGD